MRTRDCKAPDETRVGAQHGSKVCTHDAKNRDDDAKASAHDAKAPAHDAKAPAHDAKAPAHDAKAPAHDATAPDDNATARTHDAKAPAHTTGVSSRISSECANGAEVCILGAVISTARCNQFAFDANVRDLATRRVRRQEKILSYYENE